MTADPLSVLLRQDRAIVIGGLARVATGAWAYLLLGAGLPAETMQMGSGRMMGSNAIDGDQPHCAINQSFDFITMML